jgi:ketosteroid isomerase-like protein
MAHEPASPQAFAEEWIAAWNARDLERILSHYTEDVEFASPSSWAIRSCAARRRCGPIGARRWRAPDLHFTLEGVFEGAGRLALLYRRADGRRATESFVFGPDGRVSESMACNERAP